MNLYTPRRPFVRTSSPESVTDPGESGKLRADASGPLRGRGLALPAKASAVFFFVAQGDTGYGTAATAGVGSRQGCWSRSMAQQRTTSLRATATMACFLCVLPPCVKRW